MSIALPIAARRRGACPSLDAPIQTGDGLLARLRIAGSGLSPNQLAGIAEAAARHGNGLVEISARGNLQVRGLRAESAAPFADDIRALVTIEDGLVVETPPLAGDDPSELADPRPLAAAIRAAAAPLAHQLGPKVTVVVDGGGELSLSGLKADFRLLATADGGWTIGDEPARSSREACDRIAGLLGELASLGPDARGADLGHAPSIPGKVVSPIGHFARRSGHALGLALPFGAATADRLIALAGAAARHDVSLILLAPAHALLAVDAAPGFADAAAALGFIADPTDPQLRLSACIGSAGCASGHVPARAVAARIATGLPAAGHIHVSGCTKGCAHPGRAALTVVGRAEGYGLVIGGRAGDTPRMILRDDQIESAIRQASHAG